MTVSVHVREQVGRNVARPKDIDGLPVDVIDDGCQGDETNNPPAKSRYLHGSALRFQKVFAHRAERVDQHARLKTDRAMIKVRGDVETVASA